jgi:hypothetical protein
MIRKKDPKERSKRKIQKKDPKERSGTAGYKQHSTQ